MDTIESARGGDYRDCRGDTRNTVDGGSQMWHTSKIYEKYEWAVGVVIEEGDNGYSERSWWSQSRLLHCRSFFFACWVQYSLHSSTFIDFHERLSSNFSRSRASAFCSVFYFLFHRKPIKMRIGRKDRTPNLPSQGLKRYILVHPVARTKRLKMVGEL